ncbi:response regulator [Flocculibacter collagenilyticus]|uniref:response regulator n=1 Tax=Flocculibacter collagenilyticus TaxID=2744479 RepID=UPI0018F6F230|nr:response regulator [Flocculibacter collagenilyticus]
MSTPVLICDDSNMARKQMARCLPENWDVDVTFAGNGQEGMTALREGKGEVLFLDLNMPVMDGYEVLQAIKDEGISVLVVVVSGDIQPEARDRVMSLGALDFIKKPIDKEKLAELLEKYGVKSQDDMKKLAPTIEEQLDPDLRDVFQELTNVAMGQAGDLLARLLNVFVKLPIPNVNLIEVSELSMALRAVEENDTTSGTCQGFIGGGVSGEALLILNDSSFKDIAKLMQYQGDLSDDVELELLMDISNILTGAVLSGLAVQLDMGFSQGHPVVLGQHCNVSELIKANAERWKKTLAIEISYGIENYDITVDLLLMFTEDSLKTLKYKVEYLLED